MWSIGIFEITIQAKKIISITQIWPKIVIFDPTWHPTYTFDLWCQKLVKRGGIKNFEIFTHKLGNAALGLRSELLWASPGNADRAPRSCWHQPIRGQESGEMTNERPESGSHDLWLIKIEVLVNTSWGADTKGSLKKKHFLHSGGSRLSKNMFKMCFKPFWVIQN